MGDNGPDMSCNGISRREFLQGATLAGAGVVFPSRFLLSGFVQGQETADRLEPFGYGDVTLESELHEKQLENTHSVLMALSEDGLLKPFRQMGGQDAPGEDLGGWYMYKPDYDYHKDSAGLCPGGTFGQWVSALSRMYAITGDAETREKVLRLNRLYAQTISAGFYEKNRFPAYCYDKLVCGLIDAHQFAGDPKAFEILRQTTDAALPQLPERSVDREQSWRPGKDLSYNWDESYTLPENLFLACQRGAGERYRQLAIRYLGEATYFDPLAEGKNVLPGKHAYSYVNALNSAMLAYLTLGSEKHLRAAKNAFAMLVTTQSFATGGWGPDELLRAPGSGALAASLAESHNSFETPCGAYAHFKLTRYLLMVTQDSRYGDSMEQVMYNTVLGAKHLQPDGTAFYYSDYNFNGRKTYATHRWPCCSGTLPQVAADYRINTYFRDSRGIYVNLYIPSTVRFGQGNARIELTQRSTYPFSSVVQFQVKLSQPAGFRVCLRIPTWAEAASISVNGKREVPWATPGSFAAIYREWKNGDRIEIELPSKTRLEAIDTQHPGTVALLHGPMVLFAITKTPPRVTKRQLLAAKREGTVKWHVDTADGAMTMLPFTAVADEQYSTYLRVG